MRLAPDAAIGGHAHGPRLAAGQAPSGRGFAVDGDGAIYAALGDAVDPRMAGLVVGEGADMAATERCRGNVAELDTGQGWVSIATEWTGSFPLYFAQLKGGFVFASRAGLIQSLLAGSPDPVALLSFVRKGYVQRDRSFVTGIRRLQPGQSLMYVHAHRSVEIRERSQFWVGWEAEQRSNGAAAADRAWSLLETALRAEIGGVTAGMMISGGWDSRTLLAAGVNAVGADAIAGYSHGDPVSREIAIARAVAATAGVSFHQEPIGAAVYDASALRRGFDREETIVFPHWIHAGEVLSGLGVSRAMAGVYGEVLGGHYGRAMLLQGARKIAEVARALVGGTAAPQPVTEAEVGALTAFLQIGPIPRPWFIRKDYWESVRAPVDALNADVAEDLGRLRARGVESLDQLIEAYITELRGSQYINAQLRSCRAHVDIALPFIDRALLAFAARIPLPAKIHNGINRAMLRSHCRAMLRLPLAATLVPARAPILVQEGSRLVRKIWEEGQWAAHFRTAGRFPEPRLAWVNFEFLRESRALHQLVESLRSDIWDHTALARHADRVLSGAFRHPVHPVSDLMTKIATIDWTIRPA